MKNVVFICEHNSCLSQIAEALGKFYGNNLFNSYSAGIKIKDNIDKDAIRLMKKVYNIDIEKTQSIKLIDDVETPDIVIYMGSHAICDNLSTKYNEIWRIKNPVDCCDGEFEYTIKQIDLRVKMLVINIENNNI